MSNKLLLDAAKKLVKFEDRDVKKTPDWYKQYQFLADQVREIVRLEDQDKNRSGSPR